MHYYHGMKAMGNEEKYICVYNLPSLGCFLDDDSTDSYEVPHKELIHHGSDMWHDLDDDVRYFWNHRDHLLNSWPLFGQFKHLPKDVGKTK